MNAKKKTTSVIPRQGVFCNIEKEAIDKMRKIASTEKRSLSRQIEYALSEWLKKYEVKK